jgi:hypothetical protein
MGHGLLTVSRQRDGSRGALAGDSKHNPHAPEASAAARWPDAKSLRRDRLRSRRKKNAGQPRPRAERRQMVPGSAASSPRGQSSSRSLRCWRIVPTLAASRSPGVCPGRARNRCRCPRERPAAAVRASPRGRDGGGPCRRHRRPGSRPDPQRSQEGRPSIRPENSSGRGADRAATIPARRWRRRACSPQEPTRNSAQRPAGDAARGAAVCAHCHVPRTDLREQIAIIKPHVQLRPG